MHPGLCLARRETFTNIYEGQAAPRREDGAVSNGDFAAIGHTRWAALNAATEYFDWYMGVNDTTGEGPLARRMCRSMLDNKLWFKRASVDCLTQPDIPAYVSEQLATN